MSAPRIAALLLCHLLFATRAWAFNIPPFASDHEVFQAQQGNTNPTPGNSHSNGCGSPVEVATGNFVHNTRIVYIKGLGPEIDLTLMYNSQDLRRGPFGNGWTSPFDFRVALTYDGAQVFAVCGQGNGKRNRYLLNPDGTFSGPVQSRSRLVRQGDGTLALIEPNGLVRLFSPDGLMLSISDRNGNTLTLDHDESGFLRTIIDAAGRSVLLAKGANGLVSSVTTPDGNGTALSYDASGNLIGLTTPLQHQVTFQYDGSNRMLRAMDAKGIALVTVTYDASGRVATLFEGPVGYTYAYQPASRTTTKTESATGFATVYTYDLLGTILSRRDPIGTEFFTYDANARLTQARDKRGNLTQLAYDSFGNVAGITDATGVIARQFSFDPSTNVPLAATNATGNTTNLNYVAGNLTQITDAAGNASKMDYDPKGQLIAATDADGGRVTYSYDQYGNAVGMTDQFGRTASSSYDILGKVTSTTDFLGRTTQFAYDADEQLIAVTDPSSGVTSYTYDAAKNLLSITLPNGRRTTLAYDSFNRLIRITNAAGQNTTYTFDNRGLVGSMTDAKGQQITYTYDAIRRLIQKRTPTDTISFSYDTVGNLLSAVNGTTQIRFTYNSLNQPITAVTGPSSFQPSTTIQYAYDVDGNLTRMTNPNGGVTTYAYDARRFLSTLTDPNGIVFQYTYDRLGRRQRLARSGGVTSDYGYDATNRLVSLSHQTPAGPLTYSFASDAMGNVATAMDGAASSAYQYDTTNQLTAATHSDPVKPQEIYRYDAAGDRVMSHLSSSYSYDVAGRLAADDTYNYTYDANGNLLTRIHRATGQRTSFTYDPENRLTRVDLPTGTVVTYRYDALGRRVEKSVGGAITRYVYNGVDVLDEYSSAGALQARYTHGLGMDEVLAVQRAGTVSHFYQDRMGSVVATTAGANLTSTATYDSYGRLLRQTGVAVAPYAFQGREYDSESGLYQFRQRYYDPQIGRFISEDPIGYAGGAHFYRFAGNNPTNAVDPSGQSPTLITAGVGAVIGGVAGGAIEWWHGGSWSQIGLAAGKGAVIGGVTGLTLGFGGAAIAGAFGGGVVGGIAAGAVGSAVGDAAGQGFGLATGLQCEFSYSELGMAAAAGGIGGGIALRPYTAPSQTVTTWAPEGVTSTLEPGRWVMTGGNSLRNYGLSGVSELGYPYGNSLTTTVPGSSLQYPTSEFFGNLKGLMGQRVYTGQ